MNSVTTFISLLVIGQVSGNTGNQGEEGTDEPREGPGMMTDGRSHPRSLLQIGLRRPLIPLKTLVSLKTQLKEHGLELENIDEKTGQITLKKIKPSSLKINSTKLADGTNVTLNTATACPTFETFANGTVKIWTELKEAHGVKEGVDVVLNATQLTLTSIVDCVSLLSSNIGEWVRGGTKNATTTSLPPAVTTPQSKEKGVANKSKGVRPSHSVNIPPSKVKHDTKEVHVLKPKTNFKRGKHRK